eukprot:2432267-Rhodomonas_salina.1
MAAWQLPGTHSVPGTRLRANRERKNSRQSGCVPRVFQGRKLDDAPGRNSYAGVMRQAPMQ